MVGTLFVFVLSIFIFLFFEEDQFAYTGDQTLLTRETRLLSHPALNVTRWLDCLLNIWPFTAMKICPIII